MFFRDLDIIIPYKCVYLARLLIIVFMYPLLDHVETDREQIILGLI